MKSNNVKKILIVGPNPVRIGGVSKAVKNHLTFFSNSKYKIQYLETGQSCDGKDSYNIVLRNMSQLKNLFLFLTKRIDLVHMHSSSFLGFWRFCIFMLIIKIFNTKSVVHIHGGSFDKFYLKSTIFSRILIKNFLNCNDRVIVLSRYWKSFFLKFVEASKLAIVPNSVSIKKAIKKKGLNSDFKIFFLGALSKQKGLEELLVASEKIHQINNKIFSVKTKSFIFETLLSPETNIITFTSLSIYMAPSIKPNATKKP